MPRIPDATASLAACLLSLASVSAATAAAPDLAAAPARGLGLTVGLGLRSDLVRSRGLDPFSGRDGLAESALSASYGFGGGQVPGLVLGVEWDHGSVQGTARGNAAALRLDRLSFALGVRAPIGRRVSLFGRVAPGLLRDHATLDDASAARPAFSGSPGEPAVIGAPFARTTWAPAVDGSAGAAVRLLDLNRQGPADIALWVAAEGGYGYTAGHDLVLSPQAETQPGRTDEPVNLGHLTLRGPFARFTVSLTF